MDKQLSQALRHFAFTLLGAAATAVFFAVVAHHVANMDFKPLAAFCLPIQAVFFTFTSLLYIRGRSLASGKDQVRTLFAAENAMQATVWYLTGIVSGSSLFGLFQITGLEGFWLLLFLGPYLLMQVGLLLLIRAACVIAPQFLRLPSPYVMWRRIERNPVHVGA